MHPASPPRSILITGASSGLGAALARHYAATGARLVLVGRHAQRLAGVAEDCRRLGGSVVRNRARRRLREAYRRQQSLAPPEGVRLCFIARSAALTRPFAELLDAVGHALGETRRHTMTRNTWKNAHL